MCMCVRTAHVDIALNASIFVAQVINIIPTQPAPRLEGDQWSKSFKNFVSLCLVKDPSKVGLNRIFLNCNLCGTQTWLMLI